MDSVGKMKKRTEIMRMFEKSMLYLFVNRFGVGKCRLSGS